MNRFCILITALAVCITEHSRAQRGASFLTSSYIEPYRLEVAYNKTSNLVFPETIVSIDRGSQDIMAQKAFGVENILRIKAAVKSFEETNLSVITKDGTLYSFVVCYNNSPAYLNVNIGLNCMANTAIGDLEKPPTNSFLSQVSRRALKALADSAIHARADLHGIRHRYAKMSLGLTGVYIAGDVLFCRLQIQNRSFIDFNIDQFRFYIRDKKASRRTASQEIELTPLYVAGDTSAIRGKTHKTIAIALPKFTIPDGKYLRIELMERSGGRNLALKAKNRHVMKAKALSFSEANNH